MAVDAVLLGLGNPGPRYAMTRHNVGFIALDLLLREQNASWCDSDALAKKLQAEHAELEWESRKIFALKPQTFMNLSGESVRALYQKSPELKDKPLVVLHDEADIPFGQVRIKLGGGDAGHNGLKSLRECLGHGEYFRVRMGVGKPPIGSPVGLADFVLASFQKAEFDTLTNLCNKTLDVVAALLTKDLAAAQELAAKSEKV